MPQLAQAHPPFMWFIATATVVAMSRSSGHALASGA